ncbi:MAG: hypothetical protein V4586_08680 [Pseudomonadota bacterium]
MKRRLFQSLAILIGLVPPNYVVACDVSVPLFNFDRKIAIEANGSFSYAADADGIGIDRGMPVMDVGNGRVGQRIFTMGCFQSETLLFVDCNTKEMIEVEGVEPKSEVDTYGMSDRLIDLIQYPKGPIRVSKMTVGQVAAVAQKHGYTFTVNVMEKLEKMRKKNRYDPFMGCKIYYPDSEGAKS